MYLFNDSKGHLNKVTIVLSMKKVKSMFGKFNLRNINGEVFLERRFCHYE